MKTHLEQDLENIRRKVFEMADIVIEAVLKAIDSVKKCDNDLTQKVIDDDSIVDELENIINEMCIKFLATKHPTAIHLRLVIALLHINTNLERIGDLASNIAKEAKKIDGRSLFRNPADIIRMASVAIEMLKGSFIAMTEKNVELAREMINKDNIINELNISIDRELLSYMVKNPENISDALSLSMIANAIERMGDHASNIAERAIYYIEGVDIRHSD